MMIYWMKATKCTQKIEWNINVFNAAGVSVKPSTSKEFAKILTKTFFSGESIYQKGKRLNYYSAGTNSVKYIELLIKSIEAISKTKLKEPIVLFDEPEISLHTNYLDELAESFICVDSRLSLFISTHSPRLIKNIIASSESAAIYNIKLVDGYSHIYRMKKFSQYSPVSKISSRRWPYQFLFFTMYSICGRRNRTGTVFKSLYKDAFPEILEVLTYSRPWVIRLY